MILSGSFSLKILVAHWRQILDYKVLETLKKKKSIFYRDEEIVVDYQGSGPWIIAKKMKS